jgi:maltooligosyltrehalose synthase
MQILVKLTGVDRYNTIDKQAKKSYYVVMLQNIKTKYNTYQPGEFLPIYIDGQLSNRAAFHKYKVKRVLTPVVNRLLHTI